MARNAFRDRAIRLQVEATDNTERRAADLMLKLSGGDGRRLRRWLEIQAVRRRDWVDPSERWLSELQEGRELDFKRLDQLLAEDQGLAIERDDQGRPQQLDPIEEIESLAYWVVSRSKLTKWDIEPPRVSRRPVGLSQAATSVA